MSKKFDQIDDIYYEYDPIGVSLKRRLDHGHTITSVVRDTYSTSGRYFFDLRVKEPKVVAIFSDDQESSSEDILPFVMEEDPCSSNENERDSADATENSFNPNFSFSIEK